MSAPWFLLDSGPTAPAMNMALDEALLEGSAELGRPVLRFYAWTLPAATFGQSQRYADVAAVTPSRPMLRRPTGGGVVAHEDDWTYSVAVPPGHAWCLLRAAESYRRMHAWLRDAFIGLGVPATLAPSCDGRGPGQCFGGGWECSDVLLDGRKLAGAAQRRNQMGLLIQGSVQPAPPGIVRAAWQKEMLRVAGVQDHVVWTDLVLGEALLARAKVLEAEKYSQAAHNERR